MKATSLTATGSGIFKKTLADLRRKHAWSYAAVSRIIGCSRRTAINILRPGNQTAIRASYAKNLEPYVGPAIPWSPSHLNGAVVRKLLREWSEASEAPKRRQVARRINNFLSEYAVLSFSLIPTNTLRFCVTGNPVSIAMVVKNMGSRASGTLLVNFDLNDRSRVPMLFFDAQNRGVYNGSLTYDAINKMLYKVKLWHSKKQHDGRDRS